MASGVITRIDRPLAVNEVLVTHEPQVSGSPDGMILGNTMVFNISPGKNESISFGKDCFFLQYDCTHVPTTTDAERGLLDASAVGVSGIGYSQLGPPGYLSEFHVSLNGVQLCHSGDDGAGYFVHCVNYFFRQNRDTDEFPRIRTSTQNAATSPEAVFLKEKLDSKTTTSDRVRSLPFSLTGLPFQLHCCPTGEMYDDYSLVLHSGDTLRVTLRFCEPKATTQRFFRSSGKRSAIMKDAALTATEYSHSSYQLRAHNVVLVARHKSGLTGKEKKSQLQSHFINIAQPELRVGHLDKGISKSSIQVDVQGLNVNEFFFAFCTGAQTQFSSNRICEPKFCLPPNIKKIEVKVSDTQPLLLVLNELSDATVEDRSKVLYVQDVNERFFKEHPLALNQFFASKSTDETYGNIFYVGFNPAQLPDKFSVQVYFTDAKQSLADLQCLLLLVKHRKLCVQPSVTSARRIYFKD